MQRLSSLAARLQNGLNVDIDKLEMVLSQLHANAERLCEAKHRKVERE